MNCTDFLARSVRALPRVLRLFKAMVKVHGERKWAAIAQHCPGRIRQAVAASAGPTTCAPASTRFQGGQLPQLPTELQGATTELIHGRSRQRERVMAIYGNGSGGVGSSELGVADLMPQLFAGYQRLPIAMAAESGETRFPGGRR
ncbi:hypothetical protein HU200_004947 [Digitaria exilis]|uniref:Uncharacterized protein n=1 Tax=Digitaria exilis TaxID=1010633 RepID=A0A835FRR0_9POAL|nr:hypothetical protein HU200_004947 [Digitaria exilis]